MKTTIVIYGSSTGTCQGLAEKIGQQLSVQDDGIIDVQNLSADVVNKYDVLILGTSTWGAGEMQDDWYDGVKVLKQAWLCTRLIAALTSVGIVLLVVVISCSNFTLQRYNEKFRCAIPKT